MEVISITSIKDENIVFARGLQQKKERLKSRCFLIEGEQQIQWVLQSGCKLKYILTHDRLELGPFYQNLDAPIFTCSDGILKKVTGTNYLIPVIGIAELPQISNELSEDIVVVFDGVQDFGNIGTIVRTANAFGIHEFLSSTDDFDLLQRKTIDASRGSVFQSKCQNFPSSSDTIKHLKESGYQVVVTALEGSTLQSLAALEAKPTALVFGNESNGVSQETLQLADVIIQIPMATQMDSLNVGVAAGISLYEMKLKVILMLLDEKIRGSLGRNLSCTSRWLRQVFNLKLQQSTNITADQAILLMVLSCDQEGEKEELMMSVGIESSASTPLFTPLIQEGYLDELNECRVKITEKGKELLAKIWNIHESAENLAFQTFSTEEREKLLEFLFRIQENLSEFTPYEE